MRCSAECAAHEALYSQIDEDLAALQHRITKPHVDRALARWHETSVLGSVMILNGSMYMLRTTDREGKPVRHDDGQLQATLKEIYGLVSDPAWPTLPDLEVLINADDYGRVSASEYPRLPLLSITKKRGKGADILYPAGHYAVAGRSVTAIGTAEGAAEYRRPW